MYILATRLETYDGIRLVSKLTEDIKELCYNGDISILHVPGAICLQTYDPENNTWSDIEMQSSPIWKG